MAGVGVVLMTSSTPDAPAPGGARVDLLVYSGRPNPTFELTPAEAEGLVRRLDRLPHGAASVDAPGLGYSGLVVTFPPTGRGPDRITVRRGVQVETAESVASRLDSEGVESWLLDLARRRGHAELLNSLGL
jgi:hypothetical protein